MGETNRASIFGTDEIIVQAKLTEGEEHRCRASSNQGASTEPIIGVFRRPCAGRTGRAPRSGIRLSGGLSTCPFLWLSRDRLSRDLRPPLPRLLPDLGCRPPSSARTCPCRVCSRGLLFSDPPP